jgi:serine/threonine protein kinase
MGEGLLSGVSSLTPGSHVGGYVLEERIGHGGMAVVFRAVDEKLGRRVALKILAPGLAADDAFRQRFVRESRAAALVDDPHIIPVFEAGESDGALFIAMRYVPAGDLRSMLFREGMLAPDRMATILSPVASALDAAHAAGLVHRDVKPANILLDARPGRPDHVYLSDFGLSKTAAVSAGLTGTGLFLGTVDYASPEQADGLPVDGRTDQYALACTAFEMLCGEPPFARDQAIAVLLAHKSTPPPLVSSRRAGLPPSVDAVISRALAKSPEERFRTCGEFSAALRAAIGLAPYDNAPRRVTHPPTELSFHAAGPGPMVPAPGPMALAPSPVVPAARARDWAPAPGSERGSRRWPIAVAAVAVAAAIAAALIVWTTRLDQAAPGKRAGGPAGSSRSAAAGTKSAAPIGPSWTTYDDPSGFSISLPPGWALSSSSGSQDRFAGPDRGFVIVVAWTTRPRPDQLADWRQQASAKAADDPSYRPIRIQRVSYRGDNAADWEFTDVADGKAITVMDQGFIVEPRHLAYAIELLGPTARWRSVFDNAWRGLVTSFKPA